MKQTLVLGAVVVAGLGLAGCSTSNPGSASASSQTASPTSASAKPSAPRVANPLDVAKYEQNPCNVLTAAQASQFANLTQTRISPDSSGALCRWYDEPRNSVTFSFARGGGLNDAYGYQDSESGYFKVSPDISGYPAVFSGPTDDRSKGGCQLIVGVRDNEVMTVLVSFRSSSPYYADPCAQATKATEMAIATLKGGA
jgi:outer membrane murein-binding lipoprotein Lpp